MGLLILFALGCGVLGGAAATLLGAPVALAVGTAAAVVLAVLAFIGWALAS